ncbi:hypothetical protein I4U23_016159 [Adineta vaga]|nr:hypothetical protein I4U23_016159 [Adineta vaga]
MTGLCCFITALCSLTYPDDCYYRLVNRALRQRNIEFIFLFGFHIKDLYQQLEHANKDLQTKTLFTVYRGQLLPRDKIKKLKKWEFINTGFLSTTRQRSLAIAFLNQLAKLEDEY